jgi:hypothetical protein
LAFKKTSNNNNLLYMAILYVELAPGNIFIAATAQLHDD